MGDGHMPRALKPLLKDIRACRICTETPDKIALPHEPRPVLQADRGAKLAIFGQAPGNLVHQTGIPFNDPSGDRLRNWLGLTREQFYDGRKLAIIPMGFCFPGYDAKGGDLPPRKECARAWRDEVLAALPDIETAILVGGYAQKHHLRKARRKKPDRHCKELARLCARLFPNTAPLLAK